MKGLFLNNFYVAWNNLRILGIFILLLAIGVVYSGNDTLLELFPYITISVFAISGIATMREDTVSKWNRYELTLPIKRRCIIGSKYISYIFCAFGGLLFSAIVVCVTFAIHGNLFAYGLRDCFSLFSLGVGLAMIAGAMFFPLTIICGADKSEILLGISVFLSIVLAVTMINVVNMFHLSYAVRLCIFNVAYVFLYALSYLISNSLYAKKEL